MKTQNTALYILRLAVTLLLITAVVAAALGGVNAVTAPVIAQLKAEKIQKAVSEVLPGGGEELTQFPDETGTVQKVYASDTGYAIQVAPAGFSAEITMMVGVVDGEVSGISIISHTETAGLGAVAAAKTSAGEAFRQQYIGQSGVLAVSKDGGTIDALTGATITSRAVTEGVNAALQCVEKLG